jgi:hypothetical protein
MIYFQLRLESFSRFEMQALVGITSPSIQHSDGHLLDEMRREAESNALRIIQAKLEKPENLEKLDQLRTAAAQRKVAQLFTYFFLFSCRTVHFILLFYQRTLDEQLRAAVQSQLESIKTGIAQLQISLDNMKTIEQSMRETDDKLQKIAPLQSKLEDLRHEANSYRYDCR